MLKYLITLSAPNLKLIEFAKTWREANILADAWRNEYSECTITVSEILSINTIGKR